MKFKFTIFLLLLSNIILAQSTGDLTKDTTQANAYMKEALALESKAERIPLFKKANKLYEPYGIYEKEIEIKGYLAHSYSGMDIPELQNQSDSLLTYANQALELAQKHLNTDSHKSLFYTHFSYLIHYNLRDPNLAIHHGEKALQLAKKPSDNYFSAAFWLIGNYAYNKKLNLVEEILTELNHFITPTTWQHHLSRFYQAKMQLALKQQNFEKAVTFGKQSLVENKKNQSFSSATIGPIYVEIGEGLVNMGKYEEAIQYVKEGIEVSQPTGVNLASYYASLARMYDLAGNQKPAIEFALKSIAIFNTDTIQNRNLIQIVYHNISTYYYELKDFPNALTYSQKSLAIQDNPYVKMHYANVLDASDEKDKALKLIQEVLITFSIHFNNKDIYTNPSEYETYINEYWVATALTNKSILLSNRGIRKRHVEDIKQSIETGKIAKILWQKIREKMFGFDEAKLRHSSQVQSILSILFRNEYYLNQLEKEDFPAVFKRLEAKKGSLILETLTPSKLPDSLVIQQEKLVNQIRKQGQELELTTKDSTDYYQTALFDANIELENFLEKLNKNYPKQAANFYNIQYANLDDIQANLANNTSILEYRFLKRGADSLNIYIFLISKLDQEIIEIKVNKDFLDKIKQFNQLLKSPFLVQQSKRNQFINLSHELYQILMQPIIKKLANQSTLIIIPEQELYHLPFETLLSSNDKKAFHELDFLIKDFDISYQYSATIYQGLKSKPAIQNRSLLAFAPVFGAEGNMSEKTRSLDFMVDSLYQSIEKDRFIGLPNSKKEVEKIAQIIKKNNGKTTVLLEQAATKKQLQTDLKQPYQFVHIATHGLVNYKNPKLSALACHPDGTKSGNDLLFANEIQMQNIQADLVVLSSCESGIGQLIKGEGLIALNRSFIYSGANNVMFSLWKVNDQYTSNLMIDFYQSYMKKQRYTSALRQAKLNMLANPITANPRFWAAFLLIGE